MATIPGSLNRLQPSSGISAFRTASPMPTDRQGPAETEAILRTLAKEPEDAGLTGGTRSLDRRLLALNFGVSASKVDTVKERLRKLLRPTAARL
ncbi:MAG: hypothetical protein M3O31_02705 [Acidobacteriota bacterium]|nr:hypothetical protein [Acidobacteriota bacterium]